MSKSRFEKLKRALKRLREKYRDLLRRHLRLEKDYNLLEEENLTLKQRIAELEKENAELKSRDEERETSKPVFWKKNKGSEKKGKGGAPKGHKGVSRPRPKPEEVTHRETLCPDKCPDCGTKVNEPKDGEKRYYWDIIPQVVVKEANVKRPWCPTCRKHVTLRSDEVLPKKRFGIFLTSLVALMRMVGVSRPKIQTLLYVMFGFKIGKKTLQDMEQLVAAALEEDYENIKEEVRKAKVVGGDETSWRIDGQNHWLWIFVTELVTLFMIHKSRGETVPTTLLNDGSDGCLVIDGWNAYNGVKRPKQQCLIHVNRQLQLVEVKRGVEPRGFLEEEPLVLNRRGRPPEDFLWFADRLRKLMRDAVEFSEGNADEEARWEAADKFKSRLRRLVTRRYRDKDCVRISKFLLKHIDEMFTFLRVQGVPWHNNGAEQELRDSVVIRKISYGHRSDEGARSFEKLMSVYKTCRKRGVNFVDYIQSLLKGGLPTLSTTDF